MLVFCEIVQVQQNPEAERIVPGQVPDVSICLSLSYIPGLKEDCSAAQG